jgi:AraC-like DNA-binding protein
MQPRFYIEREKEQDIFYKEYTNGIGYFGFHSPIELYFVEDGEMEIIVNNQKSVLRKNQMSVALSFDAHTYKTIKNSKSSVLIIPTYLCEEFVSELKHKRTLYPFICDEKTVLKIRSYAKELSKKEINPVLKKGYIYTILGMVMDNLKFEETEESINADLSTKLLMYINDNFSKNISLSTVSEDLGYNKSYISRYFKNCFGIGLTQYITMVRLKNAVMLMHEGKHTITYCAIESGFNSTRTFYRYFSDEFNCTPKEYAAKTQKLI